MMDSPFFLDEFLTEVKRTVVDFPPSLIEVIIAEYGNDPYLILIGCLLSLRSRDTVTVHVVRALFCKVKTAKEMVECPLAWLESILYPLGFYRKKALVLKLVSQELLDRFSGIVPSRKEALLSLDGVGLKTANLVLGKAFSIPAICVDVHVHRISNACGIVFTKTPDDTEAALRRVLPKDCWIEFNTLLVILGQNTCFPKRCKIDHCSVQRLYKFLLL